MRNFIYLLVFAVFYACSNNDTKSDQTAIVYQSDDPLIKGISEKIKQDPDNSENYFLRAEQWYEQEAYEAAISDLDKAIAIDSMIPAYYHLLSDAHLDYFQSGKAMDVMNKALERFPDRIPTLLKMSELQLILKQYDASFFTIQKILNLDKQNAEAFFMMGMIYRAQGDKERAINSFQTAVELEPEITDAWMILGDLFAEKKMKIAERYYDNAIQLDPENVQTYHAKAYYFQNSDRVQDAISLYKQINEMDPQYSEAYLNTGILYLEMDSLELALEHFNILTQIEPQSSLAYYYRGVAKVFLEQYESGKEDLEQALRIDPEMTRANELLNDLVSSEDQDE